MFFQLKSLLFSNLVKAKTSLFNVGESLRRIHVTHCYNKLSEEIRADKLKKKYEGTDGEKNEAIDSFSLQRDDMFPDEHLKNRLFDNVPFSQIPVCNIKVTKNNTQITICDGKTGLAKIHRTTGIEGFKNSRKGTNIAAQATAITIGTNAISKGYPMVRVRIRGIGPGRMSALKGLQMAGINIVSITDNTPVSWNPPRPRKQRRV